MMVTAPAAVAATTASIRDLVPPSNLANSKTPAGPVEEERERESELYSSVHPTPWTFSVRKRRKKSSREKAPYVDRKKLPELKEFSTRAYPLSTGSTGLRYRSRRWSSLSQQPLRRSCSTPARRPGPSGLQDSSHLLPENSTLK